MIANRRITSITPNAILFDTVRSDLKAGDIIVSGISDNAPNGFLRKVASVKTANGQTTIETTNATIQEALANTMKGGEIAGKDFTFNFDNSGSTGERKALSPNIHMESRRSIEINKNYTDSLGAMVTAKGTLTITPDAGGKIYFSRQTASGVPPKSILDSLTYYMKTSHDLILRVESKITHPFQKEWVVDSFSSPTPVTIWLDSVPIVLTPSITVSLGIHAGFDTSSTYEYEDHSRITEGIEYTSTDQWVLPKSNEFHVAHDTGYAWVAGNGTGRIYLKTEASVTLYDTKLPIISISSSPYADFKVTIYPERGNPAIDGGINTAAFFSALPFLGEPMTDTSWDRILNVPEWTIVRGWPPAP